MLLLGCLAGLGFSLSGLFTARRKRPVRPSAARERSLADLRAGDIVQRGVPPRGSRRPLQLAPAGPWRPLSELEAEGAAPGPLLLWGAEAAGEAEAAWLLHPLPATRADLLSTPHAPATESLPHEGLRYRLHSRHHTAVRLAAAVAVTAVDPDPSLSLLCYRGPGAHRLLVTRWAGEPGARVYVGERVLGESLIVLAGT